ncbi:hypothetical protein Q8A67_023075 [Cirrhinus molitorella]|uniref:Uncharacterized protein n=1 Tax=Cirrhinus molitorella TaxID=172907 RepID=A0AA88P7W3_9TELE|nr:hypothetical protein Q8A67_023075 [Cirrhinus molitorella]
MVESECQRTEVELEGRRSLEKRRDEAKLEECSLEVKVGGMREPGGAGGLTGSGGDEGAGSHGGAAGLQDGGGVWVLEAGGGVEGSSRFYGNGTAAQATDDELRGLTRSSGEGVEEGRFMSEFVSMYHQHTL